jgi:hypothetical protein
VVIEGWGDPQRPFDQQRVEQKFRRVLAPIGAAAVERLLAGCRSAFDTAGSPAALLRDIAAVCRPGTGSH